MFGALALELVKIPGIEPVFSYMDIEELNQQAINGKFDVSKVSMATWLTIKDSHKILKSGAALSENCGPLVVAAKDTLWPPDSQKTCVIPGEHTTAHLLFQLWDSYNISKKFESFNKIMGMVINKEADYGLIIHESRFLAEEQGLKIVSDLGQWWKETTELPIPLGCLVASSNLPQDLIKLIEDKIVESISFARDHQNTIMNYIKEHAFELDDEIINKHIQTFVNEQSMELDTRGLKAVAKLEELATVKSLYNPQSQTKKPG
jgi:1,4-dihydroxy-6-naphthoate synthase